MRPWNDDELAMIQQAYGQHHFNLDEPIIRQEAARNSENFGGMEAYELAVASRYAHAIFWRMGAILFRPDGVNVPDPRGPLLLSHVPPRFFQATDRILTDMLRDTAERLAKDKDWKGKNAKRIDALKALHERMGKLWPDDKPKKPTATTPPSPIDLAKAGLVPADLDYLTPTEVSELAKLQALAGTSDDPMAF